MRREPTPPEARLIFGERLHVVEYYVDALASRGLEKGLIGPREVQRLWSRHILNCAPVAELIPRDQDVIDIGSGAGLPGLVLAIARPDLSVLLLESMQRRVSWLSDLAVECDLSNVLVVRERAESYHGPKVGYVTARAVAGLDRLTAWAASLLRPGGQLLAIKGGQAEGELRSAWQEMTRFGAEHAEIVAAGSPLVDPPTTVVRVTCRGVPSPRTRGRRRRQRSAESARRHGMKPPSAD